MECRGTFLMGLKKSVNHDCEGWTASSVVIYWSISIPISDPLFTENNIRGRDLCTVWPWYVFSRNSSGNENLSHNSDICYYYSNVDLVIFISRRQNMFCTASVQKIFYHHGIPVGLAQSQGYKPDGGQFCKSSPPSWSTCWSTCKGCKYARTLWILNFMLWSWSILP